ncbi:MAG: spore cortex biosynthesis protein YabQ [Eubacteriales bacterium]|nr:spore cortex biosynthesis protein YabQ [Eubacteriales bacterium]
MITGEIDTLIRAMLWGMILALEYDCIRIFRRVIKHYHVWSMSVEDIIFWINVGFTVFAVTYDANDGIVRGFLIGGFIAGALVFRGSFSSVYVRYISRLVIFILKMLKKIFYMIKMFIKKHFYKKNEENL